jgi:hypothetical protein
MFKEHYDFYRKQQKRGLQGWDLKWFHPMEPDGHFAREARMRGEPTPREVRDAKKAAEEAAKKAAEEAKEEFWD